MCVPCSCSIAATASGCSTYRFFVRLCLHFCCVLAADEWAGVRSFQTTLHYPFCAPVANLGLLCSHTSLSSIMTETIKKKKLGTTLWPVLEHISLMNLLMLHWRWLRRSRNIVRWAVSAFIIWEHLLSLGCSFKCMCNFWVIILASFIFHFLLVILQSVLFSVVVMVWWSSSCFRTYSRGQKG